jgi:plastocyanin
VLARTGPLAAVAALSALLLPLSARAEHKSDVSHAQRPSTAARRTASDTRVAPPARLRLAAFPAMALVGQRIRLVVLNPPRGATGYRWDLGGRGDDSVDTRSTSRTTVVFSTPGIYRVTVHVTERTTVVAAFLVLNVHRRHQTRLARPGRVRPGRSAMIVHATAPRPRARGAARSHPRAHAAGDPGVTIADFQFTPGTTTVHVGDTITWTNNGPSAHTATARDGSFDTGVLQKGASASHTFTHAGTFAFYCKIHPFMHGTIVVLAASATTPSTASTSGNARSGSTPAAAPASSSPTSSSQTLPMTGLNLIADISLGILLIGLGVSLRRLLCR